MMNPLFCFDRAASFFETNRTRHRDLDIFRANDMNISSDQPMGFQML